MGLYSWGGKIKLERAEPEGLSNVPYGIIVPLRNTNVTPPESDP